MFNILSELQNLIADEEIIIIHSSFLHIKEIENIKWPLLNALRFLLEKQYTLAIPSFTFSFVKKQVYDPSTSNSEVGVLADWFKELYGIERTLHPIYSFYVGGPLKNEIISVSTNTCFSDTSIFSYFNKKKSRILLLGCGYKYVTQFHYYEEKAQVPYRYFKDFTGVVQNQNASTTMYVRDLNINPENDFHEIANELEKRNLVKKSKLTYFDAISFKEKDAELISDELLLKNKYAFVKNANLIKYQVECKIQKQKNFPIKIALLGNSNLSLLKDALLNNISHYFLDRNVEIYCPEYGQYIQEIINENSKFYQFNPDYIFFTDTLEDIFKVNFLEEVSDNWKNIFLEYIKLIQLCKTKINGTIFINNFIYFKEKINKNFDSINEENSILNLIDKCNKELISLAQSNNSIFIINLYDVINNFNFPIYDQRLWYLAKIRYAQEFYQQLSHKFIGGILYLCGKTVRLLAIDLDNTLWGGVLGEDDIKGIKLGGDYPGNAYKDFQRVLFKLWERGIALAILSKNEEKQAIQVIDQHPDMILRSNLLAAYYINWQEKTENLILLANKINISLENILFIDDSIVEREKIRINLPAVKILDLPNDPTQYVNALLSSPYLECLNLTKEDKKRSFFYAKNNDYVVDLKKFSNINEFLKSKNIKVYINDINENNFSRAIQLINKTNQFNTTIKRYNENELVQLKDNKFSIYVVGVEDNENEYENIGLFIINKIESQILGIDSFLLSCRVLGKGIEVAMLAWIYQYAKINNFSIIKGEILFAPRNVPVRDLYEKNGFILSEKTESFAIWNLKINDHTLKVPYWLQLIDKTIGIKYATV